MDILLQQSQGQEKALGKNFSELRHAEFRRWLIQNELQAVESLIPIDSDNKPSDLLHSLLDDGPTGLKAIIQDEVGVGVVVKLVLTVRLRNKMVESGNLVRPAATKTVSGASAAIVSAAPVPVATPEKTKTAAASRFSWTEMFK